MDDETCPCGAERWLRLNGLPVCRQCYDDALHAVEYSIMPGLDAMIARRGPVMWRLPMETKQAWRPGQRPREPDQ